VVTIGGESAASGHAEEGDPDAGGSFDDTGGDAALARPAYRAVTGLCIVAQDQVMIDRPLDRASRSIMPDHLAVDVMPAIFPLEPMSSMRASPALHDQLAASLTGPEPL
jgi:hypothetical protein